MFRLASTSIGCLGLTSSYMSLFDLYWNKKVVITFTKPAAPRLTSLARIKPALGNLVVKEVGRRPTVLWLNERKVPKTIPFSSLLNCDREDCKEDSKW